jgi:ATP-dependent RNA helicase RhlB
MIFTNQRHETRKLSDHLRRHGIRCAMISGEVPQEKRIKTLEDFRAGRIRVLVATDVAGRGIHVEGISHVINYTLPLDAEDYVHRIGRTGRAGQSGTSISFACEDDAFQLPEIEAFLGQPLPCRHPEEELLLAPPEAEKPEKSDRPERSGERRGPPRARGPRRPRQS